MPRTEAMVTMRIGQKQANAATAALISRLKPKIRSESGISATEGIGRSASTVSCAARSSGRNEAEDRVRGRSRADGGNGNA